MDILRLLENQLKKKAVGTLTISKDNRFREIFFEESSIYLVGNVFSGKIALDEFIACELIEKRLSLGKLEAVVFSTDLCKTLIPALLAEQGILAEGELERLAHAQILEELVDLLFGNTASCHFQENRVPETVIDCDSVAVRTAIAIEDVLAEIETRRESQQRIDALIPSQEEVFVITETGMSHKQTHPGDYVLQRVFELIDGFRDIRTICKDSYLFENRILRLVVESLEQGFLKKTVLPELKDVSTHSLTPEEAETLLPHFKNAVRHGVDELAARERLAVIYEKLQKDDDAAIQYNFIGDALYRMHRISRAIKAYQRGLAMKPGDPLISDKISKIYVNAAKEDFDKGDSGSAAQFLTSAFKLRPDDSDVFRRLADILVERDELREISALLDSLASQGKVRGKKDLAVHNCDYLAVRLPQNSAIRKKLINFYLDLGATDRATAEMEALAELYEAKGQVAKAWELADKIQRLTGKPGHLRLRSRKPAGKERRSRQPMRKGAIILRCFIGFVLLFSFYQACSMVAWHDLKAKYLYAEALGLDRPEQVRFLRNSEESRNLTVSHYCDRFLSRFPISMYRARVQELRLRAETRAKDLRQRRDLKRQQLLASARALVEVKGRYDEARLILEELLETEAPEAFHSEVRQYLASIREPKSKPPEELLQEGQAYEDRAQWRQAFHTYRRLLEIYPKSELVAQLRFPIEIKTHPTGVDVFAAGDTEKRAVFQTPAVLHLSPGESKTLDFRAEGFHSHRMTVAEPFGEESALAEHLVRLRKSPTSRTPLKSELAATPSLHSEILFFGAKDGTITRLELDQQRSVSWKRPNSTAEYLVLPPLVSAEGIYTVWNDGRIVQLQTRRLDDEVLFSKGSEFPLGGLSAAVPLGILDESKCFLAATLAGIRSFPRQVAPEAQVLPLWVQDLGAAPTVLSHLRNFGEEKRYEQHYAVGTKDGHVIVLKATARRATVVWQQEVAGSAIEDLQSIGNFLVGKAARDPSLLVMQPEKSGSLRKLPLGNAGPTALCPDPARIFHIRVDGMLTEIVITGKEPATGSTYSLAGDVELPVSRLIPLGDRLGVVHDAGRGFVLLKAAAGQPIERIWGTRVDRPIVHVVGNATRIVLSTKEELFSFSCGESGR